MKEFKLTRENFTDCVDAKTGQPIPREGKVVLPENIIYQGEECKLTYISDLAFSGCTGLTGITFPDSVKEVGYRAFADCTNLTDITIPDSMKYIGEYAFDGCTGLTNITIPDSVKTIGSHAFEGCTGLTNIVIPDGVTSIGYRAFTGCTGLTGITIPDGVNHIGEYAFAGCTSLTGITIPDGVINIKKNAFAGCTGLTDVTFPDGMKRIEKYAFINCTGLTDITIPGSVTDIGICAFAGCTGLTNITFSDSVPYFDKDFARRCSDTLTISFMGTKISKKTFDRVIEQSDGLPLRKCLPIAKEAVDIIGKDVYSPVLVSKLCNAEHSWKLEQTAAQIKKDFQMIGFYDIKNSVDTKSKEELTALFQADENSRGVVPKIIDALTIASTELHIPPEDIVKSFEEKKFRDAVMAMRSCDRGNKFCDVETALFAMNFDVNTVKNVILESPNKDYASVLLCESYQKNDGHLLDLARWVVHHPDVSQDLVKDVVKYGNNITIDASDNVASIRVQVSKGRAMLEINGIENAYPNFEFADCKCNLPKTDVELGNYKAYIMDAKDPRQVTIGYDTDCCQHLGGAGETAMIYGLANPDAGFFVIEDKTSGKILAQAETWQTADGEKLVFDNIEFADDRQIDQFAPVLAKWCEESPYPDILMGDGYNEMVNDSIRQSEGMTPPMTDELQKKLNGWDYDQEEWDDGYDEYDTDGPYTDADESCSVLKCNNVVEPYFKEAYDNYVQEHGELPEIGSFFSEPSEEDLAAFSREEISPDDAYVMVSGDRLEDLEDKHEAAAPEVVDHEAGAEDRETDGYEAGDDFEDR